MTELDANPMPPSDQPPDPAAVQAAVQEAVAAAEESAREARRRMLLSNWPWMLAEGVITAIFALAYLLFLESALGRATIVAAFFIVLAIGTFVAHFVSWLYTRGSRARPMASYLQGSILFPQQPYPWLWLVGAALLALLLPEAVRGSVLVGGLISIYLVPHLWRFHKMRLWEELLLAVSFPIPILCWALDASRLVRPAFLVAGIAYGLVIASYGFRWRRLVRSLRGEDQDTGAQEVDHA